MPENNRSLVLPKIFLATGCVLCLVFAMCANGVAGEGLRKLRYFMQPPHVAGSATPYGNNTAAGRYVQAADAKIWYEV